MCAPPPPATIASHCVQPPRATILFHLSAPKSLFLRHVDVHIRFDTTPLYLHSFQLLAPLQQLIATLGSTSVPRVSSLFTQPNKNTPPGVILSPDTQEYLRTVTGT